MILEAEALGFSRGGRLLLRGWSAALRSGEVLRLTGPNGSGKTSLARILAGFSEDYDGRVHRHFGAREVSVLPQGGGRDFEIPFLLEELLPLTAKNHPVLGQIPLTRLWNSASGGERQRVLLARALAEGKRLVLLDEPSHNLDPVSRTDLQNLIARWPEICGGAALILIDHVLELPPSSAMKTLALGPP